jgi:hypothetical protein
MQTLRTHLIAGAAVVATAGAMTLAPVAAQQQAIHIPTVMPVSLAAFDNPFNAIIATATMAQNYVFGAYYNGGDTPTPGAGVANWTDAGFDQTGGDLLNSLLYTQTSLGYYTFVGTNAQGIWDNSPVTDQLGINISDYVNVGLDGVAGAATAISTGVWNFPSAVVDAVQLALGGDFGAAISALGAAILNPITAAGESLLAAGSYVLANVINRAGAALAVLPQILTTYAAAAAGGADLLAVKQAEVTQAVLSNLVSLNVEGAWNAAVEGLLGPTGTPGLALNLSIGAGVQTGPIESEADIPTNFVPSLRTAAQAATWSLQNALSTAPVLPSAATERPATARKAAAVAAVSAARSAAPAAQAGESAAPAAQAGESASPAAQAGESAPAAQAGASASTPKADRQARGARAARGD